MPRLSLLVALILFAGCGAQQLPPATAQPSPAPSSGTAPTADDLALADALITWARTGDSAVLDRSAFADEVAIGLGPEIVAFRTFDELGEAMGWRLDRDVFRGYVGPFSVLDQLGRDGDVVVSIGPHAHCASAPVDPPPGLADHRRMSVQPASIRSCLQWWTVDLFVGEDGRVEAVTLDLYEP